MTLRLAATMLPMLLAVSGISSGNAGSADVSPMQVLYTFSTNKGEIKFPHHALVEGENGCFYGTASGGGPTEYDGAVFRISKTGQLTPLHYFNGTNGRSPQDGLVRADDGSFTGHFPAVQ